jgi:hypothetical protein
MKRRMKLLIVSFLLLILNILYSSYVKYEHYKQAKMIVKIKDLKAENLELEAYITNKINYYSVKDFAEGKNYQPVSWNDITFLNP